MNTFLTVYLKEVKDNLRDKRSVFFALLYGPLLLPLMVLGSLVGGIKKHSVNFDETLVVYAAGDVSAARQFLAEKNIRLKAAGENWQQRLRDGELNVVIELDQNYQQNLVDGRTAFVTFYFDSENDVSVKAKQRLHSAWQAYHSQLAALRLAARGMNEQLTRPFQFIDADIAETGGPEKTVARMLPFIVIMALTLGGFYLAVDICAGERERHSLEPLLSLSMRRSTLVFAKWAALCTFVCLAGALTLLSCFLLLNYIPLAELKRFFHIDAWMFLKLFFLMLPLMLFLASAMLLIASFARNAKEAQTHLGIAMMLPMAPFFLLEFLSIKASKLLFAIPVMSQFLLAERLVVDENLAVEALLLSFSSCLALAVIFLLQIIRIFSSENILTKEA
ncbi:ABC transporter permease [Agaribacterium haliotis]|uniref:ABC transporter permease n=1 Tax=Agaribacterium haliotis TaxID=2013869 RepID=UPI000BB54F7A|nr:ABC transporter permease [Agaribacterium haliotis]